MKAKRPSLENEFAFTSNINLSSGAHILYVYSDQQSYLNNAISFITEGLDKNQHIHFVDTSENNNILKTMLRKQNYSESKIKTIQFSEARSFYEPLLASEGIELPNYKRVFETEGNQSIRTWGKLDFPTKDLLNQRLIPYEHEIDMVIKEHQSISVCAYNGEELSATMMGKLMHVHEYLMTDSTIVPSQLYSGSSENRSFPTMSDQVKREKETENLLIRSEKLSMAGQLAAGIAHEIRNPLTSIKGFFQLIKKNEHSDLFYKIIEEELSKIEQISSELLILAKPHSEVRQSHSIYQLIEDVTFLLESQAIIKNIIIKTNYENTNMKIQCEDTKIKQVLINLIKNAIEVMDSGTININVKEKNHCALISITDEGNGMSESSLKKLGEPFYTTKPKGTGLGLLVCYKIIENHGGTICVDSTLGQGTTFTVKLPLN
ncbi:ATP-binding protein [Bacillus suaedae]|uniref:histidine kinase n=1 Tax=Halalkalibacter suaedae TaxID=2822140 RepID=A0A940WY88_9BACI|nr:ATP-binding protein [Bacillus suaedae]MBP3952957.1 MEDS domain-containing protein [Bacillus suaedae]